MNFSLAPKKKYYYELFFQLELNKHILFRFLFSQIKQNENEKKK
jgi:hypothetical protein